MPLWFKKVSRKAHKGAAAQRNIAAITAPLLPLREVLFHAKPATEMLKIKLCFSAPFAALREITTFKVSFYPFYI